MARREMKTLAQLLSLFAIELDESMRDVIFIKKIVDLMPGAIIARSQNAKAGKFAVAVQATPAHDQRRDDRGAHGRYFGQRPTKLRCGDVNNFRFIRGHAHGGKSRRAL